MSSKKWKEENRDKQVGYQREYYKRNKALVIQKAHERRRELTEWLLELKSSLGCNVCGENHPAAIDFHHEDPNKKEIHVSRAIRDGWSKERILKELEKCIPLCANCHRKHHWDEQQRAGVS